MESRVSDAEAVTEVIVDAQAPVVEAPAGESPPPPGQVLDVAVALVVAAAIATIAFVGNGGLQLGAVTLTEVIADALACIVVAIAIVMVGFGPRLNGGVALFAVALLGALTAASILWSLYPADSWLEANRTMSYVAVFAAGIAAVRLAWNRSTAMIIGVLGALAVVSFYGLATKIVPGLLAPDEIFTRLREPYGYWNAVGVTAAMGMPLALWMGTRDEWSERVSALALPLLAALGVTLMMSYSRASIIACVVAFALWFAIVPLRLRSLSVLLPAAAGAALVTAWAFSQSALSDDRVSLTRREDAGVVFGFILIVVLALLYVAGIYIARRTKDKPLGPDARRKVGIAALAGFGILLVVCVGLVGATGGGFGGRWNDLTHEPGTPTNDANRLVQAGSVRTIYWSRALDVHGEEPLRGSGAGAFDKAQLRFRHRAAQGRHAHGYVHQTLADLGWVGMAASVFALIAWLIAATATLGLRSGQWRNSWSSERVGAAALTLAAVTFGVHSFLDWTWFVPAVAVTGMLTAGWVAGRGRIGAPAEQGSKGQPLEHSPVPRLPDHRTFWRRAPLAAGVLLAGVVMVMAALQPWRADRQSDKALQLATEGDYQGAREAAQRAKEINPLSPDPYFDLAAVELADDDKPAAQGALQLAVQREPASPEAWRRLGDFLLNQRDNPAQAIPVLKGALYLDPYSLAARGTLLVALRAEQIKLEEQRARRAARRAVRELREQAAAGQLPAQPGATAPTP